MIIEKTPEYSVEFDGRLKKMSSSNANYVFDTKTGFTVSWGKTVEEDPGVFPAPEILDIEVTTRCTGPNGKICPQCYKSNSPIGDNMSFETFKKIIDIFPKTLTQIAIGADATLKCNPDIWKMMEYARSFNIVPNITAADIDDETADNLAKYCGAVAISCYSWSKEICYDSIKRLTDRGMKQVNMHFMIAEETYDNALETLNDIKNDPRLEKLNALVFLSLKKKGRAVINHYNCLSQEKFNKLVEKAREMNISIGFDTCSAKKALVAFNNDPSVAKMVSSCESSRESSYINYRGEYFPCSFTEGTEGWENGLNVLECNNSQEFIDKIWNHPRTQAFRDHLEKCVYSGCKSCPIYEI